MIQMQTAISMDLPTAIPPPAVIRAYRTQVKSKESPDIIISGNEREFSQSFDFSNLRAERRNSFSAFFGLSSRQRWNESVRNASVPNNLMRPNSAQTGSNGKYRALKLYHYLNMKGTSPDRDAGLAAIAPAHHAQGLDPSLRLEDQFAKIRFQLAEMSQESGQFRQRVQSLSRAVSDLHHSISQQQHLEEDEEETEEEDEEETEEEEEEQMSDDSTVTSQHTSFLENSLSFAIPVERVQSHPPMHLSPLCGWGPVTNSVGDSDETIPHASTRQSDINWRGTSGDRQDTNGFSGPLCILTIEDADSEAASEDEHDEDFSSLTRQEVHS